MPFWKPLILFNVLLLAAGSGCTTMKTSDTARTAKEQMLISNAIDQSLQKIDFSPFRGQAVFVQDNYVECVDKNYLVASIRHRAFGAGARLVDSQEKADIVLEVRSGGVGTNNSEMFVGVPELSVPGPLPIALPEIKLFSKSSQTGTAKIGLVAYDAQSKQPLGAGGVSLARSDDNNWFVLGMGPYQNGSVRDEVSRSLQAGEPQPGLPAQVAFDTPPRDGAAGKNFRLATETGDAPGVRR